MGFAVAGGGFDTTVDFEFSSTLPSTGYFWATSYTGGGDENWILTGTGLGVNKLYPNTYNLPKLVYRNATAGNFKKNKTYQYVTQVGNFFTHSGSFSVNTPWGDYVDYDNSDRLSFSTYLIPPSPGNGYLYFYSTPLVNYTSNDYIIYKANKKWGENQPVDANFEKIYETRINEIDFEIQGFAWWRDGNSGTSSENIMFSTASDGLGWSYYADTNSYIWFDSTNALVKPAKRYTLASSTYGERKVTVAATNSENNYLLRYIDYSTFNLSFTYTKLSSYADDGVDIYLSQERPNDYFYVQLENKSIPPTAQLLATYTQSMSTSTFSYYFGLTGKQYLIIKARTTTQNSCILAISDIKITGGYWPGNNRRYLTNNNSIYTSLTEISPIGISNATFSAYTGTGNTYNATQSLDIEQVSAKIGNGKFKAGIWENGVWNSGWRYDDGVYELYEIRRYFSTDKGKVWRFQITGPTSVVNQFQVGDKISIGNIVAIDFNENRKLLKGYFTILAKNSISIVVELINNFPLKRIEKDSPNHRIKITKNIWLSGVFLNGYYTGIWNSGLFKGYPLLTEMYDSNWIDGIFDGGHINGRLYSVTFSNTFFYKGNKLGLSFSQPHKLNINDSIYIEKDNKLININYEGTASVLSVIDEYQIVTTKDFISYASQSETGTIFTGISSTLVQNFTFKSNNISKLSSVDYLDSDAVFLYNSWIDVNYYTYSAVNIGRQQTLRSDISSIEYSSNNLYGYPTDDVLSSISTFRNSYNNQELSYSLGTKYKIFNDYIGENSKFETYFRPTNVNPSKFLELGWTYSSAGPNSIIFSRTRESRAQNKSRLGYTYSWTNIREDLLVGSELQIDAIASGGVLNLVDPVEETNFRTTGKVQKSRYTMVEFNLARWSAISTYYESNDSLYLGIPTLGYKLSNLKQPLIHFDNLNIVTRDFYYGEGVDGTHSTTVNATFLPVYENVNHLLTPVSKKVEYFYNKTNLSMNFRGSGWYGSSTASVLIDDLKYYEVDMIPFFQYFTRENINLGVVIPYQGIAPFIDYSNVNFKFIDNVTIGFDSFSIDSSNIAVSGVGVGIGLGSYGGGGGGISSVDEMPTAFMD